MAGRQREFRAQLRQAGLRVTAPRLSVLGVLATAPTPFSHAEVADRLAAAGIDRATIYRNLQDLVEAGILRRTDLGDHVWRYAMAAGNAAHPVDQHPHFVCSECGAVTCLPCASVTIRATKAAPETVRKGLYEVQIRGVCDTCH
jgi:Fur family ferric uptake transcriptional regulator